MSRHWDSFSDYKDSKTPAFLERRLHGCTPNGGCRDSPRDLAAPSGSFSRERRGTPLMPIVYFSRFTKINSSSVPEAR